LRRGRAGPGPVAARPRASQGCAVPRHRHAAALQQDRARERASARVLPRPHGAGRARSAGRSTAARRDRPAARRRLRRSRRAGVVAPHRRHQGGRWVPGSPGRRVRRPRWWAGRAELQQSWQRQPRELQSLDWSSPWWWRRWRRPGRRRWRWWRRWPRRRSAMIPRTWSVVLVIAAAVAPCAGPAANAQAPAPTKPDAAPAATPPPAAPRPAARKAKRFESTEAATQAFVAALRGGDTKALVSILGSEGRTLVSSGDPVSDRQSRETALPAYDTANRLTPYGTT